MGHGSARPAKLFIIRSLRRALAILRSGPALWTGRRRAAALRHAIRLLDNAPKLGTARRFTRDEMHER